MIVFSRKASKKRRFILVALPWGMIVALEIAGKTEKSKLHIGTQTVDWSYARMLGSEELLITKDVEKSRKISVEMHCKDFSAKTACAPDDDSSKIELTHQGIEQIIEVKRRMAQRKVAKQVVLCEVVLLTTVATLPLWQAIASRDSLGQTPIEQLSHDDC